MSEFYIAIPVTLDHEGGKSNDPDDPGGATNYGVSLRYALAELGEEADFDHDGDIDADDIWKMTKEDAIKIYKEHFWDKFGYDKIKDQKVATKIFDMCVNMGSGQAHRLAQRACEEGLKDDGVLGPKTLAAINNLNPAWYIRNLIQYQKDFYRHLVIQKPKLEKFLKGWLKRASWPLGE